MDSTSMSQKLLKVGESAKTAESIDRISTLPDSVLFHILSFLPTKYAVGTSILSTRWRYLFASIPCLDFDSSLFNSRREANENPTRKMTSFMNFVERVLLMRNVACIDRLRLRSYSELDASRVNAWICAAVRHNIRELDLCTFTARNFTLLPCCLFTCKTLVVLTLEARGPTLLNVPTKVFLPSLKCLHLEAFEFLDDNSIQRLISSCPVLEDLVIRGCGLKNIHIFDISAPSLKTLTMKCVPIWFRYPPDLCKYEIVVNAPNLVYLNFFNYFVPEGFLAKNLQSLVEAHIDIGFNSQQLKYNKPTYAKTIIELLRGISQVQFLHISDDFLKAIGLYYRELPTFPNVTKLVLVCTYVGLPNMPSVLYFLHSLPCLETLAFKGGLDELQEDYLDFPRNWYLVQDVPSCLLFHLKTIEIESFSGSKDELTTVKYFLKNANVLEKMTIHTDLLGKKEESEVFKKLLMLPRSSKACQVAIQRIF